MQGDTEGRSFFGGSPAAPQAIGDNDSIGEGVHRGSLKADGEVTTPLGVCLFVCLSFVFFTCRLLSALGRAMWGAVRWSLGVSAGRRRPPRPDNH